MVARSSNAPNPHGSSLEKIWWLCGYCPVRNDARAGQHNGYGLKEFRNESPCGRPGGVRAA